MENSTNKTFKTRIQKIEKVKSLLEEWINDVRSLGNETAYSDDILEQAKKEFFNMEVNDGKQ